MVLCACNRCNHEHSLGVCPKCKCPEFRILSGPDEDGDDQPGCDIDEVEPEDDPLYKKPKVKSRGKKLPKKPARRSRRGPSTEAG